MLQIGKKPRTADANDPETLLLDCHARIRGFSELSVRLASADPAADAEVADAAARLHRYHTVALPLHQADEEQSMAPRLPPSAEIESMRAQHVVIDRTLEPLIAAWELIARDPARRRTLSLEGARALDALWVEHLALEEARIFPQLRALPADVRAALVTEFRARRQPR